MKPSEEYTLEERQAVNPDVPCRTCSGVLLEIMKGRDMGLTAFCSQECKDKMLNPEHVGKAWETGYTLDNMWEVE